MVNKLKATLKLEDTLPAFLFAIPPHIPMLVLPEIYQRFFKYIDGSTQDIDLPTSFNIPKVQHTLYPKQLTTELHNQKDN